MGVYTVTEHMAECDRCKLQGVLHGSGFNQVRRVTSATVANSDQKSYVLCDKCVEDFTRFITNPHTGGAQ